MRFEYLIHFLFLCLSRFDISNFQKGNFLIVSIVSLASILIQSNETIELRPIATFDYLRARSKRNDSKTLLWLKNFKTNLSDSENQHFQPDHQYHHYHKRLSSSAAAFFLDRNRFNSFGRLRRRSSNRRMLFSFNQLLLSLVAPRLMRYQFDLMMHSVFSELFRKILVPAIRGGGGSAGGIGGSPLGTGSDSILSLSNLLRNRGIQNSINSNSKPKSSSQSSLSSTSSSSSSIASKADLERLLDNAQKLITLQTLIRDSQMNANKANRIPGEFSTPTSAIAITTTTTTIAPVAVTSKINSENDLKILNFKNSLDDNNSNHNGDADHSQQSIKNILSMDSKTIDPTKPIQVAISSKDFIEFLSNKWKLFQQLEKNGKNNQIFANNNSHNNKNEHSISSSIYKYPDGIDRNINNNLHHHQYSANKFLINQNSPKFNPIFHITKANSSWIDSKYFHNGYRTGGDHSTNNDDDGDGDGDYDDNNDGDRDGGGDDDEDHQNNQDRNEIINERNNYQIDAMETLLPLPRPKFNGFDLNNHHHNRPTNKNRFDQINEFRINSFDRGNNNNNNNNNNNANNSNDNDDEFEDHDYRSIFEDNFQKFSKFYRKNFANVQTFSTTTSSLNYHSNDYNKNNYNDDDDDDDGDDEVPNYGNQLLLINHGKQNHHIKVDPKEKSPNQSPESIPISLSTPSSSPFSSSSSNFFDENERFDSMRSISTDSSQKNDNQSGNEIDSITESSKNSNNEDIVERANRWNSVLSNLS
ncbi:hypothetical protein SSS_04263 [Sarcoptes scabiei]|uniref:Uncharacterized protein n=1 Tax=Sarcoptes scabiei TaxID=52283 RepID=A0A834VDX7_SARSC|nr:hypothetical protein SSS_04263 [Sarcoptes scabiei]